MKTYKVQDYRDAIDAFAPFSLAEGWDNVGVLIGSPQTDVTRALLALDATVAVIAEAVEEKAQLIITHHPVIFNAVKSLAPDSAVYHAVRAGIAVLSAHTNLDIAQGGVNDVLAQRLDLKDVEVLETTRSVPYRKLAVYVPVDSAEALYDAMSAAGAGRQGDYAGAAFISRGEGRFIPLEGANPAIGAVGRPERVEEARLEMLVAPDDLQAVIRALRESHPYEEPAFDILETHFCKELYGLGRIGNLPRSLTPEDFAVHVREGLRLEGLRYVPGREKISRVAVCGGAGSHLLERARDMGAQALVTSEAKHSQLLLAQDLGMTLIDASHHATEAAVLPVLMEKLRAGLPEADILPARAGIDPARYILPL